MFEDEIPKAITFMYMPYMSTVVVIAYGSFIKFFIMVDYMGEQTLTDENNFIQSVTFICFVLAD